MCVGGGVQYCSLKRTDVRVGCEMGICENSVFNRNKNSIFDSIVLGRPVAALEM